MKQKLTGYKNSAYTLVCLLLVLVGLAQFAMVGHAEGTSTTVIDLPGLKAALAAEGTQTVVVGADLTLNVELPVKGNKTLVDDGTARTLTVASGYSGEDKTIFLVGGGAQLTINKAAGLTMDGNGQNAVLLSISPNGAVIQNGGTITNFKTTGQSAITVDQGAFTLNGGSIDHNQGTSAPGAVFIYNRGTLSVTGGTVSNNSSTANGGAIIANGMLNITGGTFSNNKAGNHGGAIALFGDSKVGEDGAGRTSVVSGGKFKDNSATELGGAIYLDADGRLEIKNAVITGNTTTGKLDKDGKWIYGFGGGIYLCPTGEGIYGNTTFNSGISYIGGNTAKNAGSDFFSEIKDSPASAARQLTIAGLDAKLYKDAEGSRYTAGDPVAESSYYTNTKAICALHAVPNGSNPETSGLLFEGNTAGKAGGAIANNGLMSDRGDLNNPKIAPELVTIAGLKIWNDDNDKFKVRPQSITVHLKADGAEKGSMTVSAANGWKYSFDNLPKTDASGKTIAYTIEEEAVSRYRATVEDQVNLKNDLVKDYSIRFAKADHTTGVTLAGSAYDLYRKADEGLTPGSAEAAAADVDVLVGTYTTGGDGTILIDGLIAGTYYFKEVTAPTGFTVDPKPTEAVAVGGTGSTEPVAFTAADARIRLVISKQDIATGRELPGAALSITDAGGTVISRWVSGAQPVEIDTSMFKAGETYTLTEESAPAGYAVAESIKFRVATDENAAGTTDIYVWNQDAWQLAKDQTVVMQDTANQKSQDTPTSAGSGSTGTNAGTGITGGAGADIALVLGTLGALGCVYLAKRRKTQR